MEKHLHKVNEILSADLRARRDHACGIIVVRHMALGEKKVSLYPGPSTRTVLSLVQSNPVFWTDRPIRILEDVAQERVALMLCFC
jgi:hypothetical protein